MSGELDQWIARGRGAFARNDYLAALEDLQRAAERKPEFPDIQNLIGLCLSMLGKPEEALEAFDRAIAVNPGYVEALLNRAITLNDLGRLDEARASYEQAGVADEEKSSGRFSSLAAARLANLHGGLGDAYLEAGAPDEAVAQFRRAVELRPQFLDIRTRLARTLIELGRTDEAKAELNAALDSNPSFAAARVTLGLALFRSGDPDGAEREWRRSLAQSPGNPQVTAFLAMLERGRDESAGG
jgi:tetratricopeptide (TPR) repeat protein